MSTIVDTYLKAKSKLTTTQTILKTKRQFK